MNKMITISLIFSQLTTFKFSKIYSTNVHVEFCIANMIVRQVILINNVCIGTRSNIIKLITPTLLAKKMFKERHTQEV